MSAGIVNGAAIPDPRMERSVGDAAAAGSRKQNGTVMVRVNFSRAGGPVCLQAGVAVVEFELPAAVEILPVLALELRLGVFGTGNILRGQCERGRQCQEDAHGLDLIAAC